MVLLSTFDIKISLMNEIRLLNFLNKIKLPIFLLLNIVKTFLYTISMYLKDL